MLFTFTLGGVFSFVYVNYLVTSTLGTALLPYYYYANNFKFLLGDQTVKAEMC